MFAITAAEALNKKFGQDGKTEFKVESGRKYHRIVKRNPLVEHSGSVYMFVTEEGDVLKAAGWKAPAKHVRHHVETPEQMNALIMEEADLFGGWLYMR